jgi:hypothetical protein
MDPVVERALNVVNSKPEWLNFVKNFNHPGGFKFSNSPLIGEIKNAIDAENPIHSGASLATCLQECRQLLNKPVDELETKPHYRIFH